MLILKDGRYLDEKNLKIYTLLELEQPAKDIIEIEFEEDGKLSLREYINKYAKDIRRE